MVRVRAEAWEHVDDSVVTFRDGHRHFIQAKEAVTNAAWRELWSDVAAQFTQSFARGTDRILLVFGESPHRVRDVREAANRAAGSPTTAEWVERLTSDQADAVRNVATLTNIPEGSDELRVLFASVDVEVLTLRDIEIDLVPRWMPPSTTSAIRLFRLLRDRVPGEATIRAEFDRETLIASLVDEEPSFRLVTVSDADIASAAAATTSLLRQHRATFGATRHHLRRAVVDDILTWFAAPQADGVAMLIDDAGTGKSVVMRDVTERLTTEGFAVLAMKADLQLTGVATADEIRDRLQLPDSVERIVERLARSVPVAVIVDQIDALSLTLAHDAATMVTVLDLIARLKRFAGVGVLISCRRFDRTNDVRLRRFDAAKEFPLIALTDDELKEALTAAGVPFDSLTGTTRELLRIPLHLDLYLLTAAERNTQAATLQDLYASLLRSVAFRNGPRLPSLPLRTRALKELTAHMFERQRTTAAATFFADAGGEELHGAATWLASEGVLIDSDGWAFRHQTLFDYLFARDFVEAGGSLIEHLRESPQGLASRTALVQVLSYQRGTDSNRYLQQLNAIWNAPDIRFHLRHLLMRWFGMLRNPTQAETVWARRLLIDPAARRRFLRSAQRNPAWFAALRPELEGLLRGDEAATDDALWYFVGVMRDCQRDIVSIVQPRLAENDDWRKRGQWMISWIHDWTAPEAIDFFDEVMKTGATLPEHFFEFKDMARLDAERTAKVILHLLDRQVDTLPPDVSPSGVIHSFNAFSGSDLDGALTIVAERAPDTWLGGVVRLLERVFVFTDLAGGSGHSFRHDAIALWSHNFDDVERHVVRSALTALITVGERDRDAFSSFMQALSRLEYITAQVLVARAYTHFGSRYASDSVQFLLDDARRFWLGSGDAIHTRRLIGAIASGLTDQDLCRIEDAIFRHVEWHSVDPHDALKFAGIEHLYLLSAIPRDCLSDRARQRFDELRRKFPNVNLSLDRSDFGIRMLHEHSPIEPAAAEQMRDDDWLRAMSKYNAEVDLPRDLTSPRALAELLKAQTKKEPKRFAALSERMSAGVVDCYAAALIEGLSESSAPPALLLDAIRRFASQPGRRIRREVSWALRNHLRHITPDLLDMLESWVRDPSLDDDYARNSLDYLNTDRGSALLTLGAALRTIDRAGTADRRFALYDHIAANETKALRAAVIEELVFELYDNHDRAINTLDGVIAGHSAELLDAYHLPDLVHGAIWRTFSRVQPIIVDLIASTEEKHRQAGARLVAVAAVSPHALTDDELELARGVVDMLVDKGQQDHKTAISRVLSRNVDEAEADYCFSRLLPLMRDADDKVRSAVSQVFHEMTSAQFVTRFDWLQAYVASPALPRGLHEFADYLIEHGGIDAPRGLTLISSALDNAFDPDEHRWFDGRDFIQFVLRVDTDPTHDASVKSAAMDVFDRLMERYGDFAESILEQWDRR